MPFADPDYEKFSIKNARQFCTVRRLPIIGAIQFPAADFGTSHNRKNPLCTYPNRHIISLP
jgi:hypothetical protein